MTLQISHFRRSTIGPQSVRTLIDRVFFLRLSIPICAALTLHVLARIGDAQIPLALYPLSFCATWLVYLIDYDPRVSPEDVSVHPERCALYWRHLGLMRNLRAALAAFSIAFGLCLLPHLVRFPVLALPAAATVLFYISPAVPILRRLPKLKNATSCKTSAVALTWWLMPWAAISAFDPQFRYAHLLAAPSLVVLIAIVVETILRDLFDGECDRQHGIRSFANLYPTAAGMVLFAGVLLPAPILLEIWPLWRASLAIAYLSVFAVLAMLHRIVALRTLHRVGDLTLILFLLVL